MTEKKIDGRSRRPNRTPLSEAVKQKIAESRTGQRNGPQSDETKAKKSIAIKEAHARRKAECEALGIPYMKRRKDTIAREARLAEAEQALLKERLREDSKTQQELDEERRTKEWIAAYRAKMQAKAQENRPWKKF